MTTKVRDRDKGYRRLVKNIYGAKAPTITIGIHAAEGAADHDGPTLLQVAEWMEFGTKNCPPRSFLRAWFDENEAFAKDVLAKQMQRVVKGQLSADDALKQLGELFVGKIQQRIADRIPPPLAESTIARKGSDVPLIDTGQLRSGITAKVETHH